MLLRRAPCVDSKLPPYRGGIQETKYGGGQTFRVAGRNEHARHPISKNLWDSTDPTRDDKTFLGHCFQNGQSKSLLHSGMDHHRAMREVLEDISRPAA